MKIVIKNLFLLGFAILMGSNVSAQDLPKKSLASSVAYTIGLTKISIDYSSPAVKERTIWGDVVPYDAIWRAGANAATTIEFSTDVSLEGKPLAAGKYAFFVIPVAGDDTKWTVVFNTVSDQWGAYAYDESKDALRVDVKPQFKKISQERLTYTIHDQTADKGYFKMAWGKARLYVRFKVDVLEEALANVDKALDEASDDDKWAIYANGASFLLDMEKETKQAMEWADKSTSLHQHSWNLYIKAKAQAASGDYTGAVATAAKSAEVGMANTDDHYYQNSKSEIEKSVADWQTK